MIKFIVMPLTEAIRSSGKANEIKHGDFIIGDDDSESTGEGTTLKPHKNPPATSEVYYTDAYKAIGSSRRITLRT